MMKSVISLVVAAASRSSISSLSLTQCRFYSKLKMPPRPLVLCGPSGVGKSTIVAKITKEFPKAFGFSVSHTTRQPREGEVDGVSYHYVDTASMQESIDNDEFIETAVFSGNMYGTSKAAVKTVMDEGKICILDIVIISYLQGVPTTSFRSPEVLVKASKLIEITILKEKKNTIRQNEGRYALLR